MARVDVQRLLIWAAALGASACVEPAPVATPLWDAPQADGERVLVEPEWEFLWMIGRQGDDILASPRLLAIRDSLFVWWDAFDHQVTAATLDGDIRWRFGREGQGPGEFGSVGAVEIDEDGTIVVLDTDNQRLTRLSSDGELISMIRTPDGFWRGLSLQPSREVILAGFHSEPFVGLDSLGNVRRGFAPEWAGFGALSTLQKQGSLITGASGRWAYAFLLGNGWFPYVGDQALPYTGRSVEHTVFPGLVEVRTRGERSTSFATRPTGSVSGGWIEGDTLNAFFEGESEYARQVIDQYSWREGSYLRSLVLPVVAEDVAGQNGLFLAIVSDPEPTIRAFRMRASPGNEGPH